MKALYGRCRTFEDLAPKVPYLGRPCTEGTLSWKTLHGRCPGRVRERVDVVKGHSGSSCTRGSATHWTTPVPTATGRVEFLNGVEFWVPSFHAPPRLPYFPSRPGTPFRSPSRPEDLCRLPGSVDRDGTGPLGRRRLRRCRKVDLRRCRVDPDRSAGVENGPYCPPVPPTESGRVLPGRRTVLLPPSRASVVPPVALGRDCVPGSVGPGQRPSRGATGEVRRIRRAGPARPRPWPLTTLGSV